MAPRFFLLPLIILCTLSWPCAEASPPRPGPVKEHVAVTLWLDGLTLGPGESKTWFEDNVLRNVTALEMARVFYFTAIPIGTGGIENPWVDNDQIVEVTNIFYILKGENHARDGSGGERTYQVNVTVKNRDAEHPVTFRIFKAELK